jgi:GAF domain-containing protein
MNQISPAPFPAQSPAPSIEAPRRVAAFPSFGQTGLTVQFNAYMHREDDLDAVVHEACRIAAEGVGAGFARVLQYQADEQAFVLQAAVGWPACTVGQTRVAADQGTTARLAWLTGQLIHLRHLDAIDRIRMPEATVDHEMRCMASVPIHGGHGEAFGLLEVGSAEVEEFTRHDLAFLQRLANSMTMAMGLHASRASRPEQAGLNVEQQATALPGWSSTAVDRHGPTGSSCQQGALGQAD